MRVDSSQRSQVKVVSEPWNGKRNFLDLLEFVHLIPLQVRKKHLRAGKCQRKDGGRKSKQIHSELSVLLLDLTFYLHFFLSNPSIIDLHHSTLDPVDILVDALLGTSESLMTLSNENDKYLTAELIRYANGLRVPVLSVDCPSGVDVDTGNEERNS